MSIKKAKYQLYYTYNDYWKNYEIRVENKDYNNSILIAEVKTEKDAQFLTRIKEINKRRSIGLLLSFPGKYASAI